MKCRVLAVILMPALAACNGPPDAPTTTAFEAAAATPSPSPTPSGPERLILAFGDSLFAGYGLDEGQGYPDVLQAALRTRGINARVIDAGVSGDTTAAGRQRLAFVLDAQQVVAAEFDGIYAGLAARFGTALVPFFLEPVYDKPALIQQDRVHPTAEGI